MIKKILLPLICFGLFTGSVLAQSSDRQGATTSSRHGKMLSIKIFVPAGEDVIETPPPAPPDTCQAYAIANNFSTEYSEIVSAYGSPFVLKGMVYVDPTPTGNAFSPVRSWSHVSLGTLKTGIRINAGHGAQPLVYVTFCPVDGQFECGENITNRYGVTSWRPLNCKENFSN